MDNVHKFQRISKVDETKKLVLTNFQVEEMTPMENIVSTIVKPIMFVVFVLLHFKSGDPLANRGPPILAGPPSQVSNKSLWCSVLLIANVWILYITY